MRSASSVRLAAQSSPVRPVRILIPIRDYDRGEDDEEDRVDPGISRRLARIEFCLARSSHVSVITMPDPAGPHSFTRFPPVCRCAVSEPLFLIFRKDLALITAHSASDYARYATPHG